jgi:hypothetical protein
MKSQLNQCTCIYISTDSLFLTYGPGVGDTEHSITDPESYGLDILGVPVVFYRQELTELFVSV